MGRWIVTGATIHRHGFRWEEGWDEVFIEDGRIAGYGHRDELSHDPPAGAHVVRLPGGCLLPAFYDAHLHLDQGGRYLGMLALRDVDRPEEVVRAVADASRIGSGWLIGIGLRETSWPSLDDLNRAAGNRPVLIYTRDYHTAVLSKAGLRKLGITNQTHFPEGGWQTLDEKVEPSGVLHENAVMWAEARLPESDEADYREDLKRAMRHLVSLGVLGVSDSSHADRWQTLLALNEADDLPLRVEQWNRCISLEDACLERPRGDFPRLRRSRIKLFIDGALGSRTAWMKAPYNDQPGTSGEPVPSLDRFREILREGAGKGWSFAVHAIGDAGVEFVTNALVDQPAPGGTNRIEHIQHTDAETLSKLRASGLTASIQPTHRLEDNAMLLDRIGDKRTEWAFPLRSLLSCGGGLVLGTDWPVVNADPLKTMYAALLPRKPGEGMVGEELTVEEALYATTAAAADVAGFTGVGRTEAGAPADLVWLESEPGRAPESWLETHVSAVISEGRIIHADQSVLGRFPADLMA